MNCTIYNRSLSDPADIRRGYREDCARITLHGIELIAEPTGLAILAYRLVAAGRKTALSGLRHKRPGIVTVAAPRSFLRARQIGDPQLGILGYFYEATGKAVEPELEAELNASLRCVLCAGSEKASVPSHWDSLPARNEVANA